MGIPVDFAPYVGLMALYRARPGQVRAGQQDLAAIVTRVNGDGTVAMRIYASDAADVLLQDRVPPMSQETPSHYWHLPDDVLAAEIDRKRVSELETQLLEAMERLDAIENPGAKKVAKPAKQGAMV